MKATGRPKLAAAIIGCCAALAAVSPQIAAPATGSTPSVTAPAQLTRAYPLGPQRLCCVGPAAARAAAGSPARQPRSPARSAGSAPGASSSVAIWVVLGAGAAFLVAAVPGLRYSRRRRFARAVADRASIASSPDRSRTRAARNGDAGGAWQQAASAQPREVAHRSAEDLGDATGAFNLGVVLHERRDFAGAIAAYQRSEQRGDPDAAFNLGVLLYETGDLDDAEAAWRRAVERGNMRAGVNLGFLLQRRGDLEGAPLAYLSAQHTEPTPLTESAELAYRLADEHGDATGAFNLGVVLHERRDFAGAIAAYQRSEQRGDPDAAFNLGVTLYETGDLDDAEAAWRRAVARGHPQAAANLAFLLEHRGNGAAARLAHTERSLIGPDRQ